MMQYPSIQSAHYSQDSFGQFAQAYYKYDGSNLRWEWSRKKGWNKFGTRRQLFDKTSEPYNQAIPIFMDTMADSIVREIKQEYPKIERITAFTEFFGPSSFAGSHDIEEEKELRLFDIALYKIGLIRHEHFRDFFKNKLWVAELVWEGIYTKEFIERVRQGKEISGIKEGVIVRESYNTWKIKTYEYLNKLKSKLGEDWILYSE